MKKILGRFSSVDIWSSKYETRAQSALNLSLVTVFFLALVAFAIVLGTVPVQANEYRSPQFQPLRMNYCDDECRMAGRETQSTGHDKVIIQAGSYVLNIALVSYESRDIKKTSFTNDSETSLSHENLYAAELKPLAYKTEYMVSQHDEYVHSEQAESRLQDDDSGNCAEYDPKHGFIVVNVTTRNNEPHCEFSAVEYHF